MFNMLGHYPYKNQRLDNRKQEQTLGRPVLPLVYIMTATPFLDGRLGGEGLSLPSFSISENDFTIQLLVFPDDLESFSGSLSSR